MADQYKCSQETKDRIERFKEADKAFREAFEKFESSHELEIVYLDRLREDRNVKLDEAKRRMRAELEAIDEMRLTFAEGPFKAQKKFSDFYIPEKLVAMLEDRGLYDAAIKAKIVAVRVETANFEEVKSFLRIHGVEKEFECCEDGKDYPGSIGGPKTILPFGSEVKKE